MRENSILLEPQVGNIHSSFEAVKQELLKMQKEYQSICFTEETKNDAKKVVAQLRKEKKVISEKVKAAVDKYIEPCRELDRKAEELYKIYDDTISPILSQITAFEEKRRQEKKKVILELYEDCIAEMSDYLPLKRIYNPKWENTTITQKAIREEMMRVKQETRTALATIQEMHSDVEEQAMELYLHTFDFTKAVDYITRHEKQKAEILAREQERIRREAEERIRQEERRRMEAERRAEEERQRLLQEAERRAEEERQQLLQKAEQEKQAAIEQAMVEAEQQFLNHFLPEVEGEAELYEYRIELTVAEKEKLELYMNSVGIEWERI